jgi:hypothetical protein
MVINHVTILYFQGGNMNPETPRADFSWALERVKSGRAIFREGWNGKGLLVKMQIPDQDSKMNMPYLYIQYPNGDKCPWLASQTDIIADDWNAMTGDQT